MRLIPLLLLTLLTPLYAGDKQAALDVLRKSAGAVEITLPVGSDTVRLALEPVDVFAPALAARYPGIRAWKGIGIEDPAIRARVELGAAGLYATIDTAGRQYVIMPQQQAQTVGSQKSAATGPWQCQVASGKSTVAERSTSSYNLPRRRLRLAIATTSEFTARNGNAIDATLARLASVVNNLNEVYDRVGIEFELVASNDQLIYTDAGNDPYSNENTTEELDANQANIDNVVGPGNYDIGHLFTTDAGGFAQLSSVCSSGKARGATGDIPFFGNPAFFLPYVKHEIGHQFGANHTFNGTAGNCDDGRRGEHAYEPGSGSTIMSYAGTCGAEDIVALPDNYYHTHSLDEIGARLASLSSSCGEIIASAGSQLSVAAGSNDVIPAQTPFRLQAQVDDADNPGATPSVRWEQFNLGAATNVDTLGTDLGNNPLFRSRLSGVTRQFPDRFSPTDSERRAEVLPAQARTLRFRATAVDNGRIVADSIDLQVIGSAGPFVISAPVDGETWLANQPQVIRWDVAGTDVPPVDCAAVDISDDDGLLLAAVPNNGEAPITLDTNLEQQLTIQCTGRSFFARTSQFFVSNTAQRNNKPPIAVEDIFTVTGGATITIDPLSNDIDPDPDEVLTLTNVSQRSTAGGALSHTATNITYTAPSGFTGTDQATYQVIDSFNRPSSAQLTFNVTAPPPPPGGGTGGGGGGGHALVLVLLGSLLMGRRRYLP
ncbi:MAG: cadherin-like domain-containing protein [Gammaproteobacteria bacterium]|nr:cadherin-like domain-containing protein [Gammaproteobacteria bacterium]